MENQMSARPPVLTLKNLYRILTRRDFPRYSYCVFPEEALLGQTLVRFWYSLFQQAFPEDSDLSVFDPEGKRNRNQTRLMNRTGSGGMMESWFMQLSAQLNTGFLLRMTDAWMTRLGDWDYDPRALTERLEGYTAEIAESQDLGAGEASLFFRRMTEEAALSEREHTEKQLPVLFQHGLILSWLTLYALYGCRPGDAALNRLRTSHDVPAEALYRRYRTDRESDVPKIITSRQSALCIQPLPEEAYFGNRMQLEEAAKEMAFSGKVIVTGIGGIGKTEFARQLLALMIREKRYARVAFTEYEGSLENSFLNAFSSLRDRDGHILETARRELEDSEAGKTLLMIDNVDCMPAEDPALNDLAKYGCDVLITTRFAEADSFRVIRLSGLEPEEGRKLFFHHYREVAEQQEEIDAACSFVAGHPLAIMLFARLCRARFWTVEKLNQRLRTQGLTELSYIHQASPVKLADIFARTFALSNLDALQKKLMMLFALLPYRYWLPETLTPYAGDIETDPERLTDHCQVLYDLGWLLMGDEGFAIHPLIAETVRTVPVTAGDFPALWDHLEKVSCGNDDLANRVLVSVLLHTSGPDHRAIRLLSALEQSISSISYMQLPGRLYEIHRQYLDGHSGNAADEMDYWLALGIRDIVVYSRRDRLNEYLGKIIYSKEGLAKTKNKELLYTLLEYASSEHDLSTVEAVFRATVPEDPEALEMADHLISYSIKQRQGDHDPEAAIGSLQQANRLLEKLEMQESMRQSNLDYRWAVCLLDLGRSAEARPLLESCLDILKKNQYPDDAVKVMSTRSTYAVALEFLGEYDASLREFEYLAELYDRQDRTGSAEYAMMRNNTALLLDLMGRPEDARKVMKEVMDLDQKLILPKDIPATHQRNAAFICSHCGLWDQAAVFAGRAVEMRTALYGEDSPWTADAQAVQARIMAETGDAESAMKLAEKAYRLLEKEWGPDHRHTRNAGSALAEIRNRG